MRFILLMVLLCLAPIISQAQGSLQTLTLEDAVKQAIKNNPRLSAATREVGVARSGTRAAQALTNPDVLFTPAVFSAAGSDTELLIQQPLELNGTRASRAGIADAHLHRAQALAVVELRVLVFEVKFAYFEMVRAHGQHALSVEALKTAEEFDRRIKRLVEEGKRPGIDLVQTGIEVAQAQQRVNQTESQIIVATATLNTLRGTPANQEIGALSPLSFRPIIIEEDTVLRQALLTRTEISAEESAAQGFRQEARLARAQGLPDLIPQFRATHVTRGFRDYGIGIGVTLPLLDYGSRRNRIRQAEQAALAQDDRTTAQRNLVKQEVRQAIARLRSSETLLQSYQTRILDRVNRLLEATRIGLQEGQTTITVLTVLEAQRTYRTVQGEYVNAQVDNAQARAELERAIGAVPASLLPQPRKQNE